MRKVDPTKHEAKRGEILAAAERCFERSGFHGATIAQICDEARISPGHLYHYFPSKEAIVAEFTTAGLDYVRGRVAELGDVEDPIGALVQEFERLKSMNRAAKAGVLMDVLAQAARNPDLGKVLQDTSEEMRELVAGLLRRGQARAQVDPALDADMAAALLVSLIDSCNSLSIRAPNLDPEGSARALHTMITRFLSPPGASARASGRRPLARVRSAKGTMA